MKRKIYEKIIKIMYSCIRFMKNRSIPNPNCQGFAGKRTNIVKDKGLFKGNRCNIHTFEWDNYDKGFEIWNSFYMNCVTQRYCMLTDITYRQFVIPIKAAKWMEERIDCIDLLLPGNDESYVIRGKIDLDKNTSLELHARAGGFTDFTINSKHEGMDILNNWNQLDEIKRNKGIAKNIYNIFKGHLPEYLVLFCKRKDGEISINLKNLLKNEKNE